MTQNQQILQMIKAVANKKQPMRTVVLESYEGQCKRVRVYAQHAHDAMAAAQIQFPGWTPVEVL